MLFWEEEKVSGETLAQGDVVDLFFSINCRSLPVDHAFQLTEAILAVLPWIVAEPSAGIHQIHVASSQNGWERPEATDDQLLVLSRRTKLTLRVPSTRVADTKRLTGARLDISGHAMTVGAPKIRPLSSQSTQLARYLALPAVDDESSFLRHAATELDAMGITLKKALCGKARPIRTPEGRIQTRSLLIANLPPEHALLLQREGLGPHRELGCGLFLGHKGIDPVIRPDDESALRDA